MKFKELLKSFYADLTAIQTSQLLYINHNTVNKYYNKFRERVVELCSLESSFKGEKVAIFASMDKLFRNV